MRAYTRKLLSETMQAILISMVTCIISVKGQRVSSCKHFFTGLWPHVRVIQTCLLSVARRQGGQPSDRPWWLARLRWRRPEWRAVRSHRVQELRVSGKLPSAPRAVQMERSNALWAVLSLELPHSSLQECQMARLMSLEQRSRHKIMYWRTQW
jgi:hypothetical protein